MEWENKGIENQRKNLMYEETRVYAQKYQLKMMFKNSFSAKAVFGKIFKMFAKKVPFGAIVKCVPVTVMKNNIILCAACILHILYLGEE